MHGAQQNQSCLRMERPTPSVTISTAGEDSLVSETCSTSNTAAATSRLFRAVLLAKWSRNNAQCCLWRHMFSQCCRIATQKNPARCASDKQLGIQT